jgi:hypothetical protein
MIPRRKMMRRRVGKMRMEVKQRKKRTRMRRKKKRNVMLPVRCLQLWHWCIADK